MLNVTGETMNDDFVNDVRAFWNQRAGLGQWAGSRDVIAKQLEIKAIASYVHDGMSVLDFGCGNGITAIELARRYDVRVIGVDFAAEMVEAAKAHLAGQDFLGSVRFQTGDVRDLSNISEKFDLIYTERTLINLPDWPTQCKAIQRITTLLKVGGIYIMCENSQDGLDKTNSFRERIGLPQITPPWHNRYLRDAELQAMSIADVTLEKVDFYSSTYYFLSRVLNAWLAWQDGKDPDYESPINQLALQLPPYGDMGQGRIWVWRKLGINDMSTTA
jgi:ubiquinone/menaquinone biosynthesis C-methylase UbiE